MSEALVALAQEIHQLLDELVPGAIRQQVTFRSGGDPSRVLELIRLNPGSKNKDIAQSLGISPNGIGAVVFRLRDKGLIRSVGVGRWEAV